MRRLLLSATALTVIALSLAVDSASAQGANPNQPNGAPPAAQGASPATSEGVKPTQDQSGSSQVAPTTSQQGQGEQAVSTPSGKTGKEEPSAHAPTQNAAQNAAQNTVQDTAVLVDGKLNVPGAPKDSQTVPAKFSERNDRIDKLPIMAMPLGLSDAQRRAILASVKQAGQPVQSTSTKPSEELPANIVVHDLGASSDIPEVARLKYVRTPQGVLLVEPSNRIVVGEIAN
jgi:hypothetical protein